MVHDRKYEYDNYNDNDSDNAIACFLSSPDDHQSNHLDLDLIFLLFLFSLLIRFFLHLALIFLKRLQSGKCLSELY